MRRILTIAIILTSWLGQASGKEMMLQRTDTLIIELGNNSKLIIYVDSQEDLKSIEEFDINEMIREINRSIDSSGNAGVVEITDDTGERFLKDTVITIDKRAESIPEVAPAPVLTSEKVRPDSIQSPKEFFVPWNKENYKSIDTMKMMTSDGQLQNVIFYEKKQEKKPEKKRYVDYRTSRLNRNYFAVDFGLNNWLQDGELPNVEDELYTVKPVGSWYAGGRYFRKIAIGGPVFIDFGTSVTWYTWKFENKNVRVIKNDDQTEFVEDLEIDGIKSKLSASYLNIEFIPTFDFSYGKVRVKDEEIRRRRYTKHVRSNGFTIGIGGYAGYRLDSWTKNVYKDANGDEKKDKEGSTFHLNNLRYGARVEIGLDYDFSIFANYDLNTVFVEDKGPKLNAVSFGATLRL